MCTFDIATYSYAFILCYNFGTRQSISLILFHLFYPYFNYLILFSYYYYSASFIIYVMYLNASESTFRLHLWRVKSVIIISSAFFLWASTGSLVRRTFLPRSLDCTYLLCCLFDGLSILPLFIVAVFHHFLSFHDQDSCQ